VRDNTYVPKGYADVEDWKRFEKRGRKFSSGEPGTHDDVWAGAGRKGNAAARACPTALANRNLRFRPLLTTNSLGVLWVQRRVIEPNQGQIEDFKLTTATTKTALELRSVCWVITAFRGLGCRRLTCISLKLRLSADSSPT